MTNDAPQTDVEVNNDGSIVLLSPRTKAACQWIEDNIGPGNGFQPYYPTIVCEPRYVDDIIFGMQEADLIVS